MSNYKFLNKQSLKNDMEVAAKAFYNIIANADCTDQTYTTLQDYLNDCQANEKMKTELHKLFA